MVPAQPPLPTASNFPFQSAIGSQISILMSESDEGVSVAVTRQKVGSWPNCGVAGSVPGRANFPAGTTWVSVIEVFGSAKDDRLSHDEADVRAVRALSLRGGAHTIHQLRSSLHVPPKFQREVNRTKSTARPRT